ncbi:MAG: pyridoxal phosphate-dependent decarboxylase family protein, partial [Desulfocucumaceae bacterium]
MLEPAMRLPARGTPGDKLLKDMSDIRSQDANWKDGRTWSLVYYAGEEIYQFLKEAYTMFFSENGLNVGAFPSLRKFESEVVAMTADMLGGGPEVAGSMTSCGTESILMAIKTYRDMARAEQPEITAPELLMPETAHPAFEKAAHYFDVKPVRIPVRSDFRADVAAMEAAINNNTILMVGSAPAYPHGVIDPIEKLASLALERGIGFHVDSCLGGFLLPFVRKLGYPVPEFDFRVPGVTSMSADVHKYGFAAKGASTVLYRDKDMRRHQFFVYTDWSGGIYASPTMTGTRPGGAIAAAWAIMNHLGEEGYLRLASVIMKTAKKLMEGVNSIPGLYLLGQPDMSVFAFSSDTIDIYALGDAMDARGWHLDRQQKPPCLHLMVTPAHEKAADQFLSDLRDCTLALAENPTSAPGGSA